MRPSAEKEWQLAHTGIFSSTIGGGLVEEIGPNRQRMLEDFKIGIITHALQSHCSELVKEMGIFTWQKFQERMKASAQKNQHDDCVMAAAGGYYVLQFVRTRVQRHERRRQEEVLVVGRNGLVLRREQAGQTPRSQKLWLN